MQLLFVFFLIASVNCLYAQKKEKTKKKSEKCSQMLNPLATSNITVKTGEIICYAGEVHGSVGSGLSYSIKDESIIKLNHETLKYNDESRKNMPGGDKATKTYAFKAIKEGETTLTVNEMFRGEVKNSYSFQIKVK